METINFLKFESSKVFFDKKYKEELEDTKTKGLSIQIGGKYLIKRETLLAFGLLLTKEINNPD